MAPVRWVLLAGLGLGVQGTPVKFTDTEFTLPEGYRAVETGARSGARVFRRVAGQEPGSELRIGIQALFSELHPKAPFPYELVQQLGLPANARVSFPPEPWRKFQVPALEYRFEDPQGPPQYGRVLLLPLELRTFVLQVAAPQSLEEEARADLRKAAASAVGKTYWREGSIPGGVPFVLGLIGGPLVLGGWLWGTFSVYRTGERGMGCLCFLFSPAAIVYGLIHFDEMKAPTLTHLAGLLILGLSIALSRYAA